MSNAGGVYEGMFLLAVSHRMSLILATLLSMVFLCFIYQCLLYPTQAYSARPLEGLRVNLAHPCAGLDVDNNRTVVLQLLSSGHVRINQENVNEGELPTMISKIMLSRQERVLFVVAQDDLSYDRFVRTVDTLKAAVPELVVLPEHYDPAHGLVNSCLSSAEAAW